LEGWDASLRIVWGWKAEGGTLEKGEVVREDSQRSEGGKELVYYGEPDFLGLGQLREAWEGRELLYSFFKRDLLIRYRQVFVGVLWVLVQPLLGTLIFLMLFHFLGTQRTVAGQGGGRLGDASLILIGMLFWQLVNNSLRDATGSLVNYRHVITKIYFPRMLLPLSSLMCALFDLLVGFVLLVPVVAMANAGVEWWRVWGVLPALLWLVLFCFGAILWLSSLNAQYRDVGYALPFVLQIGMFISPVVYGYERIQGALSPVWQILYTANPVASCIGIARWAVLGAPLPPLLGMMLAAVFTAFLVISGLIWFQRSNQSMADRI